VVGEVDMATLAVWEVALDVMCGTPGDTVVDITGSPSSTSAVSARWRRPRCACVPQGRRISLYGGCTGLIRHDSPDSISIVALWSGGGAHEELAERWPLDSNGLAARIARERAVVRIEDWSAVAGHIASTIRERMPVGMSIMAPVYAHGQLWGGLVAHSRKGAKFGDDIEREVAGFAALIATAIRNAEAEETATGLSRAHRDRH
jgi:hypothetical protein